MTAEQMGRLLRRQRDAFQRDGYPDLRVRLSRLSRLEAWIVAHQQEIVDAAHDDFGHRVPEETLGGEVLSVLFQIRHVKGRLRRWMRPSRRHVHPLMWFATARVRFQPKGVVGIISSWNYPIAVCLGPLVGVLAAGNRAVLKPSEHAPKTSSLICSGMSDIFSEEEVTVVEGGLEVGQAFASQPWDHLVFTGSTTVGRHVLRAAAENLVPVTLELGGKSPAVVGPEADLNNAASRILWGRCYNAGQTCIAPDYALVQRSKIPDFVDAMKRAAAVQYPSDGSGSGFTTLLGAANRERQMRLLEEARTQGAEVIALRPNDDGTLSEAGELGPHAVIAPPESSGLATEEIFGPILPIVPYDTFEDVLGYINARPRPLAAYLFEDHRARRKQFLEGTTSGSVGVNDVIFQFVVDSAPFGGIGSSGMGAYHGEDGFREFSHRRTIFQQSKLTLRHFMTPPYGRVFRTVLRWFIR
jgi:coniferyl-aldehyde dehydrogenase